VEAKAPPGMDQIVKRLKKDKRITNPFALAWYLYHKKGKSSADILGEDLEAEIEEFEEESRLASSGETPADVIRVATDMALRTGNKMSQTSSDYVEVPLGTNCAKCMYAVRLDPEDGGWEQNIGECELVLGKIDLINGCCSLWKASPNLLKRID